MTTTRSRSSSVNILASTSHSSKNEKAEQASAKTIESGFPTYDLTSKRLKPIQQTFDEQLSQKNLQELTRLQLALERVNKNLEAIAAAEAEETLMISGSLAEFRKAQEQEQRAISWQIAHLENALKQGTDFRFFILGCEGNAKKNQIRVAELMSEIALDPANRPDFILLLGDNFYDHGVNSAEDEMFRTHFEEIYGRRSLAIRDIPCFVILGNHDENIHKKHMWKKQGIEVGMHQVVHSYLEDPEVYVNSTLDLDQLPKWNMPARAYSLRFADTEIFCIDSNTYALEFLAAQNGDVSLTNQTVWLETKVKEAQANGRKVMLALHHPLVTQGKRAFISDLNLYLSKEKFQELKELLPNVTQDFSYNALLNEIIKKQELIFNAVLSAHDHYQAYYNNVLVESKHRLCQITAGGGGGGTHARKEFQTQSEMGYFIKGHGATLVKAEIDTPELKFNTYSVGQRTPIVFTNQSPRPVHTYPGNITPKAKRNILMLHTALLDALSDYFAFLSISEPSPQKTIKEKSAGFFSRHGKEGINRAHKLWGYLNKVTRDDYKTTLEQTMEILGGSPTSPDEHSLITYVTKHLENTFGKGETLQSLLHAEESIGYIRRSPSGHYLHSLS